MTRLFYGCVVSSAFLSLRSKPLENKPSGCNPEVPVKAGSARGRSSPCSSNHKAAPLRYSRVCLVAASSQFAFSGSLSARSPRGGSRSARDDRGGEWFLSCATFGVVFFFCRFAPPDECLSRGDCKHAPATTDSARRVAHPLSWFF
jgi:hypothetical protein